jgi:DeoR/GlpR family transcriptional regulator of sugar metabolism
MEKNQFAEIRRQKVLEHILKDGQASVADLSRQFGVSQVTMRADLQMLASQNLVLRTHGGALPAARNPDISFAIRARRQVEEKERIGAAAANLIKDGDAVFLDTSSTSLAIVRWLKNHRDLTVVTNSLAVAQAMINVPNVVSYMPGGTFQRDTLSLVGTDGLGMLEHFHIHKGFFGAHGISDPEGLTDVSAAEAEVKACLVAMCRQVIAVLDHTKWGRVGLASFARLEDLHIIVTDRPDSPVVEQRAHQLGIDIILA